MVKVFSYGNVTVQVLTRNEHAPPHVHVVSPDYSVELDIPKPEIVVKPPSKKARVKNNSRFVKEAIEQVTARREDCIVEKIAKIFGSSTSTKEPLVMIKEVQYLPISREVEVLLSDGSRHAWRVDDLEMLSNVDGNILPLPAPNREQLLDVIPYGGGAYLYWPQIEQMFELDALLNGVYGRESWMEKLRTKAAALS